MTQKIVVFEPGLPNTPGWTTLSNAKKEWLQQKTSNIKRFGAMEGLAAVSTGLELIEVKNALKGESMRITDYIRTVYGENSERTGFRRLEYIEALMRNWPADLIKAVAEKGALLLRGTAGIGIKDLIHVSKELPAPTERDEKTIDAFIENKVRLKLREHKTTRRTGKVIKLSEDEGMKILFNNGRSAFRAMKNVATSTERRHILRTVVGWWMEELAITGMLECRRISIPEGTVAKRGRPRKN